MKLMNSSKNKPNSSKKKLNSKKSCTFSQYQMQLYIKKKKCDLSHFLFSLYRTNS